MVNYGYGPGMKNWDESKKHILANRIEAMVEEMKENHEIKAVPSTFGNAPYVEVDNLYTGVRIRKITHLSEAQTDKLIEAADKIYNDVMLSNQQRK